MFDTQSDRLVSRPTICPFCRGKAVDTLAKAITPTTLWRCRECEKTWTLVGQSSFQQRS